MIVAESWFFRDRQVFEFVADFAVTRAALPGRSPVRILSRRPPRGEEPYSVAMALLEAGLSADQFTIDAIDISRRALERAAAGRYSANAFRNADLSFRDRWFTTDGGQAGARPSGPAAGAIGVGQHPRPRLYRGPAGLRRRSSAATC